MQGLEGPSTVDARSDHVKEVVTPAQIVEQAPVGSVKDAPLTATQAAGMSLARLVGAIIFLVLMVLLIDFYLNRPVAPHLMTEPSSTIAMDDIASHNQRLIEDYRALNEISQDRSVQMFQVIVAAALLPVFTGILGYIFGRATADTVL